PHERPDDQDGDGYCAGAGFRAPKVGDRDNCPTTSNPGQADGDFDCVGDACDKCPAGRNPRQYDQDADGIGDLCDNCPTTAIATQTDGDGDGQGDACDPEPLDPTDRSPAEVLGLAATRTGPSTTLLTWTADPALEGYFV